MTTTLTNTYTFGLTTFEQRGSLGYFKADGTFKTVDGWFYINNNTVVMRKIRGRNRFAFCSVGQMHDFISYVK